MFHFLILVGAFSVGSTYNGYANATAEEEESKLVLTSQGLVKGYKDPIGPFVFYGIPYATAPTGKNKFKAPLPPPTWMSTFEAVDKGVTCPQVNILGTNSEDCLIANVFVPDTNKTNLPVYVIAHGGGYDYGSGNTYTPKALVQSKDIVAVTFNYRLGVHGFLCLGTENVPGNAGMKDQVAALRWVKKNIAFFGGNPEDITLGGYSAGASAVDLLMLSKSADGLFNKVIPESAANVAPWSAHQEPLEAAQRLALSLNFTNTHDMHALEEFYTTTELATLNSKAETFLPCIERNYGEETFLEEAPVDILKSGNYHKLPILYGFCKTEGLFQIPYFSASIAPMNENFSNFLPMDLTFETQAEREDVANKIRRVYFGDQPVGVETVEHYIDYYSDTLFIYPILRAVRMHIEAGHHQIYLYKYWFPTEHVILDNITINGAEHVSQSIAVFDEDEESISEDYRHMKVTLRDLWSNFITTGDPVPPGSSLPSWPPVDSTTRFPVMVLDTNMSLERDFLTLKDRVELWDEVYEKHYKTPMPPFMSSASSNLNPVGRDSPVASKNGGTEDIPRRPKPVRPRMNPLKKLSQYIKSRILKL